MTDHTVLREVLVEVSAALKETALPFALTGGYAAWAHGGPEPSHDVDFLVRHEDAGAVARGLGERGFEVSDAPEDWLFKVHARGVLVDVLHRMNHSTVDAALARSEHLKVSSIEMPVLTATDVVGEQLLALDEHYCDYATVLPTLRALREKLDWVELRDRLAGHPFAEAALFLAGRLDIATEPTAGVAAG